MEYTDELLRSSPILNELNHIALSHEIVEGNLVYEHPFHRLDQSFAEAFFDKRYNLFRLAQGRNEIMEVGINAGHSAAIMLLANPAARFTFFDLCFHKYSVPCFEYLKALTLYSQLNIGDSRHTLPRYIAEWPDKKFDLIHIDGGHTLEIFRNDLEAARILSTPRTMVVLDDVNPAGELRDHLITLFQGGLAKLVNRSEHGLKPATNHEIIQFI